MSTGLDLRHEGQAAVIAADVALMSKKAARHSLRFAR